MRRPSQRWIVIGNRLDGICGGATYTSSGFSPTSHGACDFHRTPRSIVNTKVAFIQSSNKETIVRFHCIPPASEADSAS